MKDKKLLGVLFTSLIEDAMSEVIDCTTLCATWVALEAVFAHSSTSRTHQLCDELLSLRRDDLLVDEYSRKFKFLCDQLSTIGPQ